jgi:hypothetical protein
MAATRTPYPDRIRYHGGDHLNGGVSRLGEYFVAADRTVAFHGLDGTWQDVPADNATDTALYWAMVNHNKALLGIE